jgi:tRNA pseudouridine38-40 synthase
MVHPQRVQLLVRFGYDGSRFHGLQPQKVLPTAGGALRERLQDALGQRPRALQFAARTDAGVHALDNAATTWVPGPLDLAAVERALQRPRDDGLRSVRVFETPISVHARGSSRGKRYRYRVRDGAAESDLEERYAWHIVPTLDVEAMRAASAALVGEHDFTSFRGRRCSARSPVKRIVGLRVGGPFPLGDGTRLTFIDVAGSGFLRKMIRILVGTLVEVGVGWRPPDDVARVLDARDRSQAGLTAPARGLILMKVGMAWPPDGSGLVPELAPLSEDEPPAEGSAG